MLQKCDKFNVISIESQPDCKDFPGIYEGLGGDILINPSKGAVKSLIRSHPERPLILLGHGDENGLYNKDWNGYIVSSRDVDTLRKVPCIIGVWCYAGNFADRYGLYGFFTSMFISNQKEAVDHGFLNASPEDITYENRLFAKRLNKLCRDLSFCDGRPLISTWVMELQRCANITKGFVRFNYEAMTIYN